MKRFKSILCTIVLFSAISINAIAEDNTRIPMLEQGKAWTYILHHFDYDGERYKETTTGVIYQLEGDTVIDGRQYMKMYRRISKINSKSYYGAFREDEEGRVWQYDYQGDQKDFRICDITCEDYPDYIFSPGDPTISLTQIRRPRRFQISCMLRERSSIDICGVSSSVLKVSVLSGKD